MFSLRLGVVGCSGALGLCKLVSDLDKSIISQSARTAAAASDYDGLLSS